MSSDRSLVITIPGVGYGLVMASAAFAMRCGTCLNFDPDALRSLPDSVTDVDHQDNMVL